MKKTFIYTLIIALIITACGTDAPKEEVMPKEDLSELKVEELKPIDTHTLSNYQDVAARHIHLDIEVDFDRQILFGTATHTVENLTNASLVRFDTDGLDVKAVKVDGKEAIFELGEVDELLGQQLTVQLPVSDQRERKVAIDYSTKKGAKALDWLDPIKTAGKKYPYLFTQGQAVLTRSWLPCMDTPGLRITYSADVKVPKELMAVMSANNPIEKNETGEYHFEMKQPIPCYLMALAVGNLTFAAIDERTGVYTEPEMIEACAAELSDMGKMVDAAEGLYGQYQWERYDVIVLPPSFPFGGMENPRLTFATPTIIAGDKSLTALIAHELAHSWSGNLVTNSTWNDFWLNEGFTVYFERRIMEEIYGEGYSDMLAVLGYQDLEESIRTLDPKDQMLKLRLSGRNPDDGMTDIAYEKGNLLLVALEHHVGREKFDSFIKGYFEQHKFQTLTTEDFVAYLNEQLLKDRPFNTEEWIYKEGIPANHPIVVSENFNRVESQLNAFKLMDDVNEIEPENWSTHEWLHFIRNLDSTVTNNQMAMLDNRFHLTDSKNSEIAAIWFQKSINKDYWKVDEQLEEFLVRVGRRKFLVPLYKALAETETGKKRALEIYEKARPGYHHVSISTLDGMLY